MRTRCKLTALTPKEPSRRYQRERPDAPCISTSKRCSPTFKRRRSSHHRQPWETGKDVGYRVLHVAIDDCAPLACVQMPPDEQRCATACLFLPRWPRIWARSACIPQVATDHEPEIAPDCSAMRRMLGSNISALGPTREDQRRSRALHPLPAAKWPFIPVPIRPSKGREPAKRDCPPNARGHGLASPEGRSSLFPVTTWREVTSSNFKSRLARRASRSSLRPPPAGRLSDQRIVPSSGEGDQALLLSRCDSSSRIPAAVNGRPCPSPRRLTSLPRRSSSALTVDFCQ